MTSPLPHLRLRTADGGLIARDGIVICFFIQRSHGEIVHAVWQALRVYREAVPVHALGWYSDSNGDFQPLDDKGWERIREKVFECRWPAPCGIDLEEHCEDTGGYNFEYEGRWLDAPLSQGQDSTCALSFTLPTEYVVEQGPARVRSLALALAHELPFSFGYASFALVAPRGQWFADTRVVRELRDRYLGLDIYRLGETGRYIGANARGAYWLTLLGPALMVRLGGLERLRRLPVLDLDVQVLPSAEGERVLVTLSEWPEAIDTRQAERPSRVLRVLAQLLEPFFHEERSDWFSLLGHDRDDMHRWTKRFCP